MTCRSAIASSRADCVLGAARLISSASTRLAKTGPGRKTIFGESPCAVAAEQFVAGDVGGHQVRRELDPRELPVERRGEGLDHQRLGQAGDADQQGVGAGERRRSGAGRSWSF